MRLINCRQIKKIHIDFFLLIIYYSLMLTKNDLQAIRQIVTVVVKEEVKKEIRVELSPVIKEIQKLRKDLNVVITSFDGDIIETKLRVDRIEGHLHLPPFITLGDLNSKLNPNSNW